MSLIHCIILALDVHNQYSKYMRHSFGCVYYLRFNSTPKTVPQIFLNFSVRSSSHMEEKQFMITSFLEDGSALQNRLWVSDDEVLEKSDMTNNESDFT